MDEESQLTPLCIAVLMEKGIIVGIDHEPVIRKSLDFALYRMSTNVSPSSVPICRTEKLSRHTSSFTTFFAII